MSFTGEIAAGMLKGFHDCDYGGCNIKTFDLPLMQAEFLRAGFKWSYEDANIIDCYRMWQLGEPRTLSDAVKKFLEALPRGAPLSLLTAEVRTWIEKQGLSW